MSESEKWLMLVLTAAVVGLLVVLAPVITPFLVSALFAYLWDPLTDRLETWHLSRTWAVVVVFFSMSLVIILAIIVLIPLIEKQISYLVEKLPDYVRWFQQQVIPWLQQRFGISAETLDLSNLPNLVTRHWKDAGGILAQAVSSISQSGMAIVGWLASLVMIPVVTFYLLRDWDRLIASIHALIPRQHEPWVAKMARETDEVLSAFIRGQLLVMVSLGCIYATGLWLIGLKLALLIGLISGLVSFVPYLGFIIGIVLACVAVLVQTQEILHLVLVLMVFGLGQLLESFLLTPWLVGDRIGLHPVAVIFAILAGGQLFGFFGVLLALPTAAVIAVLLRHVHEHYVGSELYSQSNDESKAS